MMNQTFRALPLAASLFTGCTNYNAELADCTVVETHVLYAAMDWSVDNMDDIELELKDSFMGSYQENSNSIRGAIEGSYFHCFVQNESDSIIRGYGLSDEMVIGINFKNEISINQIDTSDEDWRLSKMTQAAIEETVEIVVHEAAHVASNKGHGFFLGAHDYCHQKYPNGRVGDFIDAWGYAGMETYHKQHMAEDGTYWDLEGNCY